ncbi:MAG: GMC family oxidoreductase [Pseudomonadota bacterium]
MVPEIALVDARARTWDVIIAGSSFSAFFFLMGLPRDLSVLIVEKGGFADHAQQLETGIPGLESFRQTNTSGHPKEWVAHSTFGGNSNCWWACTPRFHPSDFRMKTLYGVAQDWPISYDTLAPYYDEVEATMEISGGGSDHILPRDTAFPFPPHLPSRTDQYLRKTSRDWFAQPTARANGGSRALCCANGVCGLCPVDSKFTVINGIEAITRPEVYRLMMSEVRATRVEGGRATGVVVKSAEGIAEIAAHTVALAANGIFNAAILLRSGIELPGIGVGLNEQVSVRMGIDADGMGPYGGTSITGHGYPLYDGPFRSEHSGVLIEVYNAHAAIRPEYGKWLERAHLKLIVEDLPQDANTMTLEDDEPYLTWVGHHPYALKGLEWGRKRVSEMFEAPDRVFSSDLSVSEAHIMGTHRMGSDLKRDVVDAYHRCHGVPNLFVLGSGAFPSGSMANPTLTLSAMALRSAREAI